MRVDDLETPFMAIDLDVLDRNVRSMAEHTRRWGVGLRPHDKTHKCVEIAARQLQAGATGLTLAKIGEVEALLDAPRTASDGPLPLHDVLVAYPIVGDDKLGRLMALSERVRVTISLDSPEVATRIGEKAAAAGKTIGVLVEVDSGAGRCGTLPGEPTLDLARHVVATPGIAFRGLMTHEGQAYGASPDTLREVSQRAGRTMVETAGFIRSAGIEVDVVSVGSTPSARHIVEVPGVTEVRPGTYIFQDYNQVRLGVATVADCAAVVHATVVARPASDRAVVDAGTKAVAADRNMIVVDREGFGGVVDRPEWFFARASEEHGVLLRREDAAMRPLTIGERVQLIPNHICPAINLYDRLVVHRGGVVEGSWAVTARGRMV
jgi:D-serine deaminase-like pyridoxal phosphate-dependent protein